MKQYQVTQTTTLTVQAGSIVLLTDRQAQAAHRVLIEVKPKTEAKKSTKKKES